MSLTTGLEIYSILTTIALLVALLQRKQSSTPTTDTLLDRLLPLLIQYQTLRATIVVNPQLPAPQLLPLLGILDSVANYYQLEPIGEVWQQVPFNPQYHQGDSPDLERGAMVYVRFIGYRSGSKIYAPAKVSRQLPPNALRSNQSEEVQP